MTLDIYLFPILIMVYTIGQVLTCLLMAWYKWQQQARGHYLNVRQGHCLFQMTMVIHGYKRTYQINYGQKYLCMHLLNIG